MISMLPLLSLIAAPLGTPAPPNASLQGQIAPDTPAPAIALVEVEAATRELRSRLLQGGFDIARVERGDGGLQLLADAADLQALEDAGFPYRILVPDLEAHYAERLAEDTLAPLGGYGAWLSPPFAQGSHGRLLHLCANRQRPRSDPSELSIDRGPRARAWAPASKVVSCGCSRSPTTSRATRTNPRSSIDSLHHAREPQGLHVSLWFLLFLVEEYGSDPLATYLVDEREIYFVPVVNPDGYVYNQQQAPGGGGMWRKNRRNNGGGSFGVDLNRNYSYNWGYDNSGSSSNPDSEVYRGPSAASEPETQAMISFISSRDFRTALSIHTFSNVWLAPWGYDEIFPADWSEIEEIGLLATELNGYPHGVASILLYAANGVTIDYDYGQHGTYTWTPEIGNDNDGFWPPTSRIVPLAEENLLALQRTTLAAGAFVHVLDTQLIEVGDGDGYYEAGESVELLVSLRNSGRAGTATIVNGSLTTSSAGLVVADGSANFGSLSSFTSTDNALDTLRLDISAGAAVGTALDYRLTIEYEGYAQEIDGTIVTGQPRLFLTDDVELDLGWIAGLASDGADTGIWEHADPIGTTSNGEQISPEDDATPGSGTLCFVTGNGGGSAGNDDVDEGPTTLISPRFDLSQVSSPEVNYARWYAATGSDLFEVSISNDDGQSWVALESVTHDNEWRTVSFRVAEFLTPSDRMRLRFVAQDVPNNSLVEAAVDELSVTIYDADPRLSVYGRTGLGDFATIQVAGDTGDYVELWASRFPGNTTVPGVTGNLLLDPDLMFRIAQGTLPANGIFQFQRTLPTNPALVGATFYFQAFVTRPGDIILTNRDELTVE